MKATRTARGSRQANQNGSLMMRPLAIGTAGVLLLSSCGGSGENVSDIRTADGDTVENAAQFLAEATEQWEETIPSENVEISDDAGCFFAVDDDDAVTGDLACGGVRTTTAEDGEVWDIGEFEVRENSDNEMNAQVSESWLEGAARGVQRPDTRLVDAEGEAAPANIDELAAPPMPQTDSGLSLSGDVLPQDLVQPDDDQASPGADGEVITPAGSIQLESVATLETIPVRAEASSDEDADDAVDDPAADNGEDVDTDDGDIAVDLEGEPHAPAAGETFLLLDYSFTPHQESDSGWGADEQESYTASLALNDGGAQQTLAHFGEHEGFGEQSPESGQLLVSVAEDDAFLVVSSSGEDQEISLPSGERGENDVTLGYYRDVTEQDENHEFDISDQSVTVNDDDYEVSLYLNLQRAQLTAFTEEGGGDGWAEPDMAWLILEFDAVLDQDSFWGRFLEFSPTVEVTDESGETHSSSQTIDVGSGSWNDSYLMAVQVPADAEELSFTQTVESRLEDSDDIASLEFTAESYELSFPQEESSDGGDDEDPDDDPEEDQESDDEDPQEEDDE